MTHERRATDRRKRVRLRCGRNEFVMWLFGRRTNAGPQSHLTYQEGHMDLGAVVGGYKILEMVGEGGMGTVFRGVDVMLEREVALKLLRPELTYQPDIVKRFQKEAITLARLNHQHIVTLHHMFRDGDKNFMVLEFVRGETLDDLIKRCGPIPWQTAVPLICQALQGLEHAHILKVIHRDIKPSNLILTQTGIVKLMDFGVARILETSGMTQSGNVVGTLRYMSPEQIQGKPIDIRTDIYGMGMVLYEMLTAHAPFNKTTEYELTRALVEDTPAPPRSFVQQIPKQLEAVVLRTLSKSPNDRYSSAAELRGELENLLNDALADPSMNGEISSRPNLRDHRLWDERAAASGDRTRPYIQIPIPPQSDPADGSSPFRNVLRATRQRPAVQLGIAAALVLAFWWLPREPKPVKPEPASTASTAAPPVEQPAPIPDAVPEPAPAIESISQPAQMDEPAPQPASPSLPELEPGSPPSETPPTGPTEIVMPTTEPPAIPAVAMVDEEMGEIRKNEPPEAAPKPVKKKTSHRHRSSKNVDGGWEIISK
ncbi:MAG: hypothetical protein FIA97_00975 [Methylococcaceae bacterium]|nr:hypothetical protein [Methylococcaceae bacterium]